MCLNLQRAPVAFKLNAKIKTNKTNKARGSVLMFAVFVLVVLGFLALTMQKIAWSNSDSQTREHFGTQAMLLAQSANDWALVKMYPLNPTSAQLEKAYFDTTCSVTLTGATPPLNHGINCAVPVVSCQNVGTLGAGSIDEQSFYRISASATCGTGQFTVSRQQEVWVRKRL